MKNISKIQIEKDRGEKWLVIHHSVVFNFSKQFYLEKGKLTKT